MPKLYLNDADWHLGCSGKAAVGLFQLLYTPDVEFVTPNRVEYLIFKSYQRNSSGIAALNADFPVKSQYSGSISDQIKSLLSNLELPADQAAADRLVLNTLGHFGMIQRISRELKVDQITGEIKSEIKERFELLYTSTFALYSPAFLGGGDTKAVKTLCDPLSDAINEKYVPRVVRFV